MSPTLKVVDSQVAVDAPTAGLVGHSDEAIARRRIKLVACTFPTRLSSAGTMENVDPRWRAAFDNASKEVIRRRDFKRMRIPDFLDMAFQLDKSLAMCAATAATRRSLTRTRT
jgi:hypothetical protein